MFVITYFVSTIPISYVFIKLKKTILAEINKKIVELTKINSQFDEIIFRIFAVLKKKLTILTKSNLKKFI